jgi:hypothetical protein
MQTANEESVSSKVMFVSLHIKAVPLHGIKELGGEEV